MTLDSMSESGLFELQQYLNATSNQDYAMNKPYAPHRIPNSAHTHRLNPRNKSSVIAFQQLISNQKHSLKVDRIAYKLRMKSDLHVDTLRDTSVGRNRNNNQSHYSSQPNINDRYSNIPPSAKTKSQARQPTAVTMASNSAKTVADYALSGIEGSAVHVGTLNDLIKQFHHEEFRIFHRAAEYLDNASNSLSNNRLLTERTISKPSLFSTEPLIKQPRALTLYHFNAPKITRTPSQVSRYRIREKISNIDLPLLSAPHHQRFTPSDRQPTVMSSRTKRIQESRAKILMHTEKQVCNCNKLTIVDPFHSDQHERLIPALKQPAARYIFPAVRPFGYLTRKSLDNIAHSTPSSMKHKHEIKKKQQKTTKGSLESIDQVLTSDDDSSQLFTDTVKSIVSLTDTDDDLPGPSATRINFDFKQDKH